MKNLASLINYWSLGLATIEKVDHLQQEILQTPSETSDPCEALLQVYGKLTDEQKLAFMLAGGVPSLLQWQQQRIQQKWTGSETDQLPVLC